MGVVPHYLNINRKNTVVLHFWCRGRYRAPRASKGLHMALRLQFGDNLKWKYFSLHFIEMEHRRMADEN